MINNFTYSEIESIVKSILESRKEEELTGVYEDEYSFSSKIEEKLNSISNEEYIKIIEICEEFADEISESLTGELNMLHKIHNEIRILIDEYSN